MLLHFERQRDLVLDDQNAAAWGPVDCPNISLGRVDFSGIDVSVLDIADAGLAKAKARLGEQASKVNWIVADIRHWQPPRRYEIWHDRAMLHFLTTDEDRAAYIAALQAGTLAGALVVLATFAPDGPEKCSNLAVQRYGAKDLVALLGSSFVLTDSATESHKTPSGVVQRFSYSVFRRTVEAIRPSGRTMCAEDGNAA